MLFNRGNMLRLADKRYIVAIGKLRPVETPNRARAQYHDLHATKRNTRNESRDCECSRITRNGVRLARQSD